jgi:hypothetical protein
MKPKLKLNFRYASAGLVAALAVASAAAAAEALPKEGSYDFIACYSGVSNMIKFSKSDFGYTFEFTGATRSNPPGGLLDHNTFRCVGTNAKFGKRHVGSGAICEGIDRDGDKRLWYYSLGKDGKFHPEAIAGTGKFDGMVLDGQVEELGPFPRIKPGTFQGCNHQTGTYKMK